MERPNDRDVSAACRWLLRLQRESVSVEDALAFDRWLDASAFHRSAYGQVLATWHAVEQELAAVSPARRART